MKLNLGGGQKVIPGYVNLDIVPFPEVDIVCDLNRTLPLKNNSVDEVVAYHVLEHLNNTVQIFEELHRVCNNRALIKMKSPYYNSIGAFKDPTHKSFFTEETFFYLSQKERAEKGLPDYGLNFDFRIKHIGYIWSHNLIGILPFKHFLKRHFWNVARTIYVELKVVK